MPTAPQPPSDRAPSDRPTVSAADRSLADSIATALGSPVDLWRSDDPHDRYDPAKANWRLLATLPPSAAEGREATKPPQSLFEKASLADRPVTTPLDDGQGLIAMRLGSESHVFLVAAVPAAGLPWVERLCSAVAGQHRAASTAARLQSENDSFAEQLTSDLEELSFLRSMVDRVSSVRASDELIGMARQTLPVLNDTIHASCIALLSLRDPEDPNSLAVELTTGDGTIEDATLTAAVQRFGGQAQNGPFVRNWNSVGLPRSANVGAEDDRLPAVNSLVLSPLTSGKQCFGWLVAVNRLADARLMANSWQLDSDEFGSGEGSLIATTASILATHAANLSLVQDKEQILVSVVRSLVSAIEAKDPYTRGHSERVALYTKRIAEEAGYFENEAEAIHLSALLHDVGKIGVSDATLNKTGKLTDEEYAEISKHPDEGWAILCDLDQLRHVLPGVLHHHERWDGRGYPDGLAGEEIPLDGRVMAVADAYDAMTSDRPYRAGMPSEKAESILREGAGVQWDPNCVDAFFACLDDIHRLKDEYQQRERRKRDAVRDGTEPLELPHEVSGVTE